MQIQLGSTLENDLAASQHIKWLLYSKTIYVYSNHSNIISCDHKPLSIVDDQELSDLQLFNQQVKSKSVICTNEGHWQGNSHLDWKEEKL